MFKVQIAQSIAPIAGQALPTFGHWELSLEPCLNKAFQENY